MSNFSNKFNNLNIQELLSLGYIYLLILGIISDAIYFGFLGINILNYSSVLDVLLSPITFLLQRWELLIGFLIIILLGFLLISQTPKLHKKWREKRWYQKIYNVEKLDKKYETQNKLFEKTKIFGLMMLGFYIGLSFGAGSKASERIIENSYEMNHTLIFEDEYTTDAYVVGQNTQFIFYFLKGNSNIVISPINNNIKQIIKLPKTKK